MDFGELSRAEGIGRTEQNNVVFVFPPPSVFRGKSCPGHHSFERL